MNPVNIIDDLYLKTMAGSSLVLHQENVKLLNQIANDLYSIKQLDATQVDTLKKIIMICNVLYNRTDITVLPIEDGFYDLLLEKYKVYDQNFQVGSAVVEIQSHIESDIDSEVKPVIQVLKFFEVEDEKDELHQQIYDELKKISPLTKQDFAISPIRFLPESITKRQHDTAHNHPDLVGTLDKTKFIFNQDAIDAGVFNDPNVKVLERDFFGAHIKKGIINPNEKIAIVCELKYDGISVEADCGLEVESARTRGDTGIGVASDITPILYGYPFKHARAMIGQKPIGVKFEAIMTKTNLMRFNELRGRSYSNCRTAIVGLMGASDANEFRDLITLVPLALDRNDVPQISNRMEEIHLLNELFVSDREPLRYCYFEGTVPELLYLIKAFHDEAFALRDVLDFMYDGIVVSYVDENIRAQLGRVNYINKYSIAVKFNPLEKITTFRGYTYEVGQNGNITPMIHYDTVEFLGTLHNKSTGSSLYRFNELALKEGDYIKVTYVNDVMPYVSKLDCSHNRYNKAPLIKIIDHCPVCGSELIVSDSGKSLICPNMDCYGRSIGRMVNMFQKLNIKGFADATFKIIGKTHLYQLASLSKEWLIEHVGEADGTAFYEVIQSLLHDKWQDYMVMGALGFTSVARKKWQKILSHRPIRAIYEKYKENPYELYTILLKDAGEGIANTIIAEIPYFEQDIQFILSKMHIIDSVYTDTQERAQIRFSGCRNPQLCQQLSTQGYDIDEGSVTKKTKILLVPFVGYTSNKVSTAEKYGAKIIAINDFVDAMDSILEEL